MSIDHGLELLTDSELAVLFYFFYNDKDQTQFKSAIERQGKESLSGFNGLLSKDIIVSMQTSSTQDWFKVNNKHKLWGFVITAHPPRVVSFKQMLKWVKTRRSLALESKTKRFANSKNLAQKVLELCSSVR